MKTYLGDGVYADFDGFHVVLTTENGISATNTIYIESGVAVQLQKFLHNQFQISPVSQGLFEQIDPEDESENEGGYF